MTIFDFNKRYPTKKSAIDFIIKAKDNGTYAYPFGSCDHNFFRELVHLRRSSNFST